MSASRACLAGGVASELSGGDFVRGAVQAGLVAGFNHFLHRALQDPPIRKGFNRQNCPTCLDPSTVGKNLLGLSYPGGDNPLDYRGKYTYEYIPSDLSEYPAIGHDRRYDNLDVVGLKGLLLDTRAIGADWRFVNEERNILFGQEVSIKTRMNAFILGAGLGIMSVPKTILTLGTPAGYNRTMMWYFLSNIGVNNNPSPKR